MIIQRPEHCLCGDLTYRCKIACTCAGHPHDGDCHYGIWADVPGWAASINTDAEELGIERYNIQREDLINMTVTNVWQPLNTYAHECHRTSLAAGWYDSRALDALKGATYTLPVEWNNRARREVQQGIVCTKFALIHSEISEALEGYRKDKKDDHLTDLPAVDVELADALIRIFDLAGYLGCNLADAVERKMAYNKTRADHSAAARSALGGKKF